ncbi:hypothetical protein [Streptomyces bohaiensis]|uniref:Uncharacterized protein n=1 Tax=Streptomyces bohaiensis TaxID=1431344 RepID=A0ABX1CB48_9ACTN|nr:hypothetical protein [Streptomyces bohaiensis]NJQ13534.1 hypothetical protein [Streptomyces bohaiensis]
MTPLELLAQIPNPGVQVPEGLSRPRDLFLGMMKWGGLAITAGSAIYSGYLFVLARRGGHATTSAADAASELPFKLVGLLLISGVGAGVLGMFL